MEYDVSECIGSRMRRLSRIIDNHYRKRLKEFGISENQLTILFALYKMGKVEQGKVGQVLTLERSSVSRNIKLMIRAGWVERTTAYRPEVVLTDKGVQLSEQILPVWQETMNDLAQMLKPNGFNLIAKLEKKLT